MRVSVEIDSALVTFLHPKKRAINSHRIITEKRSLKDLVQSFGIPHTEVGGIMVTGHWQNFTCLIKDGDQIKVFPESKKTKTDDNPIYRAKHIYGKEAFVCDVHLGKLARYLRLLGFDTRYHPSWEDKDLVKISNREERILLSRDRGLLMRNTARLGVYIISTQPEEQIKEIIERLALKGKITPFSRCLLCNHILIAVDRNKLEFETKYKALIPSRVLAWAERYHFCPQCNKMFWKGSHYNKLINKFSHFLNR